MRRKFIDVYFCFTCNTQLESKYYKEDDHKIWYCPNQWKDVKWWNIRQLLFYWHPCKDDGVTDHKARWELEGRIFNTKVTNKLQVI